MQDRPTLEELLAGFSAFLGELRELLPPEHRYRALLAQHAYTMAMRELAAGDAPARQEHERLVGLLGREAEDAWQARAKLARAIRDGRYDDRIGEAAAVLRESIRAKLAVARPGWDAFSDDGRDPPPAAAAPA